MLARRINGLVKKIEELAFGNSNDAVKLVFLTAEEYEEISKLDLRMVAEVKRAANGNVEVKLLNRVALLELLTGILDTDAPTVKTKSGEAESFFTAMDRAAENIKSGGE